MSRGSGVDANKIINKLGDKISSLTIENALLHAQIEELLENTTEGAVGNATELKPGKSD